MSKNGVLCAGVQCQPLHQTAPSGLVRGPSKLSHLPASRTSASTIFSRSSLVRGAQHACLLDAGLSPVWQQGRTRQTLTLLAHHDLEEFCLHVKPGCCSRRGVEPSACAGQLQVCVESLPRKSSRHQPGKHGPVGPGRGQVEQLCCSPQQSRGGRGGPGKRRPALC